MKQLLAAVDFSAHTASVLDQAAALARALQARLWVLHVASDETEAMVFESTQFNGCAPDFVSMPGDVQLARDVSADELRHEHQRLLDISAGLRERGVDAQAVLVKGTAAALILEKAESLKAEIIILGSHGHGLLRKALLGSVSEAVIRHAPCSVLVVPNESKES
jgi:nucleotide-binding universal stress UspA family protein